MPLPLSLLALAVGAFGIGTTEFVVMGLLPELAADLGVSIPRAGLIVSGYAVGVVVGAPLLAVLTARLPRKPTLLGLMGIFVIGNLLCAIAPGYWSLMAARVLTAFAHAAFFGIGAVVAAGLVPRHQQAQAVALMFAGLTVANVLGVPSGTALGQAFGWRATFAVVAVIGVVAAFAIARWLPAGLPVPKSSVLREFRVLRDPQVLLVMAMSALTTASLFSVFTYISPLLVNVTGLTPGAVTGLLLLFGVGMTIGNLLGGRLSDWRPTLTLIGGFAAMAAVLAGFVYTSQWMLPAAATLLAWGVVASALGPGLQLRVVHTAHQAPNLASTLNQGAFNIGCASGALLGGLPLRYGYGYAEVPWVGVVLALVALALSLLATQRDRRSTPSIPPAAGEAQPA